MTRDEYLDKVRYGLRCIEEAIFQTKLLELASEIFRREEYSEQNFDRVGLLVECFLANYLADIDEVQGSLMYAEEYLKLPEIKEIG